MLASRLSAHKWLTTLVVVVGAVTFLLAPGTAHAASYNYTNYLMDDSVFTNTGTMGAQQIQTFLQDEGSGLANISDVENCSVTIVPASDSAGYSCGQTEPAAQIIYAAAQNYGINPQVLLATMQKEQSLVTTPNPTASQLDKAMGYGCSDDGSGNCVTSFFQQVDNAAWQFRRDFQAINGQDYQGHTAASYPCNGSTRYYSTALVTGNNVTFYDDYGNAYANFTLPNASTSSLYCYTPHVYPGSSQEYYSGSYWFVYYFNLWFPPQPYAWAPLSAASYTDSARTIPYTDSPVIDVTPGGTAYVTLQAQNIGYQTWTQSVVHLGTTYPTDRASAFSNNTWLSPQRIQMQQSSVLPDNNATFMFSLTAPDTPGTYVEHFSLVADGITWMNDPDFYYTINVATPSQPSNSRDTGLSVNQYLTPGQRLMSPDSQSILALQSNGDLVLYEDFKAVWSNGVNNSSVGDLVLQSDGNLVEYDNNGQPLWSSGTNGANDYLTLQTDGNVVIYSSGGSPLWATDTGNVPNHLDKVDTTLPYGGVMYPGQFMQTANRSYTLVLQSSDGNLVEYNSSGQPVWSSGTGGGGNVLVMQSDGNLVMYASNGKAIWASNTGGAGNALTLEPSGVLTISNGDNSVLWNNRFLRAGQYIQAADRSYTLVLQSSDGNLVEYNSSGQPVWSSGTRGSGNVLVMQGDGNLVIYGGNGRAIWASNTSGDNNVLVLQSDGNLVVYGSGARALWANGQ